MENRRRDGRGVVPGPRLGRRPLGISTADCDAAQGCHVVSWLGKGMIEVERGMRALFCWRQVGRQDKIDD